MCKINGVSYLTSTIYFLSIEFDYNTFINLNAYHLRELIPNLYNRVRLETVLREEKNNISSLASASHSSSHLLTSSIAQGHSWESPPHSAETELATIIRNVSEPNIIQGQDDIYPYEIENNVEVRYVNNFVRVDISENMVSFLEIRSTAMQAAVLNHIAYLLGLRL